MVRKNLAALHETTSLKKYLSKHGGLKVNPHRIKHPADPDPFGYFHAMSSQSANLSGCSTWLNIWDPYVETSTDHSLMQCGLQNYDDPQLQSLEGGWTVDHSLNGTGSLTCSFTTPLAATARTMTTWVVTTRMWTAGFNTATSSFRGRDGVL